MNRPHLTCCADRTSTVATMVAAAICLFTSGAVKIASAQQPVAAQPAAVESRVSFRPHPDHAIVEVLVEDGKGVAERVRILTTPKRPWTNVETAELIRRERLSITTRQDCLQPLDSSAETADGRHNAWLEVCSRLELAVAADPGHLGLRRDQLKALVALLGYEHDSPFAPGICRTTGEALAQFVRRAEPATAMDVVVIKTTEAWLLLHQKAFPAAAEAMLKITDADERRAVENVLRAYGQRDFLPLAPVQVGPWTMKIWRSAGRTPSPEFVWPEYHFLINPTTSSSPDQVVSYTLDVRGAPGGETFYLRFHSGGQSTIAVPYGHERPSFSLVKYHVTELVQAFSKTTKTTSVTATSKGDVKP